MKPENLFSASYFLIRNEEKSVPVFLSAIPGKGTVLDLWAWSHPYGELIKSKGFVYLAADITGKQDIVMNLNEDNIPLGDSSVDGITIFQALEHLSEPYHALNEAFRVLKSWGYAIVSTPFLFSLHGIPYDFHRYTEYFYRHVAEKYGLEIVSISSGIRGFGNVIYLFNHFIDYFSFFLPWRILVALPIFVGNCLIWCLEKLNWFLPKALSFALRDRLVSDYVVIFRKK